MFFLLFASAILILCAQLRIASTVRIFKIILQQIANLAKLVELTCDKVSTREVKISLILVPGNAQHARY